MEVNFTNELSVELEAPRCDLLYDHCEGEATHFYDVHGCAQYYACRHCDQVLASTMLHTLAQYRHLTCGACGQRVGLPGYVTITTLKEENANTQ